ncbi:MAG TPA: tetratricopeptide repeat protein, partial [Candidatus Sulfopaludibacter sp.]|nr:tetratricopeptide repeat protein [Candidatus Sulfopaludibacter sp.]
MQVFGQTSAQNASNLSSLRQRAGAGDPKAQAELGFLYDYGAGGVTRDPVEALKWYRKAAEQGDAAGQHGIAAMYFEGRGVQKDYAEAARWYRCPPPNTQALSSCKEISYKDLPDGALKLLTKMKCDVTSNYNYGSAVDLNGDGEPEYQVCCGDAP